MPEDRLHEIKYQTNAQPRLTYLWLARFGSHEYLTGVLSGESRNVNFHLPTRWGNASDGVSE